MQMHDPSSSRAIHHQQSHSGCTQLAGCSAKHLFRPYQDRGRRSWEVRLPSTCQQYTVARCGPLLHSSGWNVSSTRAARRRVRAAAVAAGSKAKIKAREKASAATARVGSRAGKAAACRVVKLREGWNARMLRARNWSVLVRRWLQSAAKWLVGGFVCGSVRLITFAILQPRLCVQFHRCCCRKRAHENGSHQLPIASCSALHRCCEHTSTCLMEVHPTKKLTIRNDVTM